MWFIPCIFVTFILFFIIAKFSNNNKIFIATAGIFCLILGYIYALYIDIKLPWAVDAAFVAVFFMITGWLVSPFIHKFIENYVKIKNKKHSISILCISILFLSVNLLFSYLNYCILNRTVGMWSNAYGNILYFVIASLTGILFIVTISNFIKIRCLAYIGKNSIFYYGIHIIFVEIIEIFAKKFPGLENTPIAFAVTTAIMIFVLIILRILCPVYIKLYEKIIKK